MHEDSILTFITNFFRNYVVEICFKIEKFSEAFSQYHSKDSKNETWFPGHKH